MKWVFLLFFSCYVDASNLYVLYGDAFRADKGTNPTYGLALEHNNITYSVIRFEPYTKTPWYNTHPEWGLTEAQKHTIYSVTTPVLEVDLAQDFNLYFNFGLSYSDHLSKQISSHFVFREELGVEYKNVRLFLSHNSNAGLKPPNRGEDAVYIALRYSF